MAEIVCQEIETLTRNQNKILEMKNSKFKFKIKMETLKALLMRQHNKYPS